MAAADSEYIVRIKTQFESAGLQGIVQETVAAFRQLAAEASKLAPEQVAARSKYITGAAYSAIAPHKYSTDPVQLEAAQKALRDVTQLTNALAGKNLGAGALRTLDPATGKGFDISALAATLKPLVSSVGLSQSQTRGFYDLANSNQSFVKKAEKIGVGPDAIEAAETNLGLKKFGADVAEATATTNAYSKQVARETSAYAKVDAQVQKRLAGDDRYIRAQAKLEKYNSIEAASVQKRLAGDDKYIASTARLTLAKSQQAAGSEAILARDKRYLDAEASRTVSGVEKDVGIAERLAVNQEYAKSTARLAALNTQQAASKEAILATDNAYAVSSAQLTTAKVQQAANTEAILSKDKAYLDAQASKTSSTAVADAGVATRLAADRAYLTATATSAVAKAQETASVRATLARNDQYIQATASAALSQQRQAAKVAEVLAADNKYANATAALALARSKSAEREAVALNNPANVNQFGATAAAQQALDLAQRRAVLASTASTRQTEDRAKTKAAELERAVEDRAALARRQSVSTFGGRASAEIEAQTIVAEKSRAEYIRSSIARQQAADEIYITSKASTANAERERGLRIRAATAGVQVTDVPSLLDQHGNPTGKPLIEGNIDEVEAATVIQERIAAERRATAAANVAAGSGRLGTDLVIAQRERIAAERAAAQAAARAAYASGEGTRLQRLQSRASLGGGNPRGPLEMATAGQFFSQKFLTTAGYALPSALLYGGAQSIGTLITQAQELEKIMNQLEAQFKSSDDAAEFPRAQGAILSIAKNTGVAADEVANTFFQFKGAFGDVDETIRQTDSAMKIVQTTGLSLKEVIDSLTAVSKTYADENTGAGYSLERLGNIALYIQESFGVASKETLTFVADLASVGKEAGASVEELAGLGAVTQQLTARSGSALAESYGRVLPAIQEAQTKILGLYSDPKLAQGRQNIIASLSEGNTFDVFKQILSDSAAGNLSVGQQKYAISLLGSRREAQALIPVFNKAQETLDAMNSTADEAANPRLENYYQKLQKTVANTVARMKESFKQLGQALFQAGLADILVLAATAAGALGLALSFVVGMWVKLNEGSKGWLGRLVAMVAMYKLITAATNLWRARTVQTTASVAANTTAVGVNTVAVGANATASTAASTAKAVASPVGGPSLISQPGVVAPLTGMGRFAGAGARYTAARTAGTGILSSGAGAIGLSNPYTAAAVAALAVGAFVVKPEYDKMRAASNKFEDEMKKKLKASSETQLKEIAEESSSTWDRIKSFIFGTDTPEKLADKELNIRRGTTQRTAVRALVKEESEAGKRRIEKFLESNREEINEALAEAIEGKNIRDTTGLYLPSEYEIGSSDVRAKTDTLDLEELNKVLDEAASGETFANELAIVVADIAGEDEELAKIIEKYYKDRRKQNEIDAAGGIVELSMRNVEVAKNSYAAGNIGRSQYIAALRAEAKNLQDQSTAPDPEGKIAAATIQAEQQLNEAYAERAKSNYDALVQYREITDTSSGQKDFTGLLNYMNTKLPQSMGGGDALTAAQKYEMIPELYEAAQAAFMERVMAIVDPAERVAAMEAGFELPPEFEALLQRQVLNTNSRYESAADQARTAIERVKAEKKKQGSDEAVTDFDDLELQAIEAASEAGTAVNVEIVKLLKKKIISLRRLIEARKESDSIAGLATIGPLLSEVEGLESIVGIFENIGDDVPVDKILGYLNGDQIESASVVLNKDLELEKIRARKNPVRVAEIDLELAKRERDRAQRAYDKSKTNETEQALVEAQIQVEEETAAVNDARIDLINQRISANANLARSLVSNNALATARINRREAEQILAQATPGTPEAIEAQANVNTAIQAERESFLANIQSFVDLNVAVAQAQGDSVKVASLQLGGARDRLNAALASGSGVAELNAIRADIVRAEAQLRDAFLQVITSQVDLQIAVAEAAGDTIKVAELQLKNATTRLQSAQANGAGVAEQNALRGEVVRAEANVRNARFNDQLGDIDYLLEIEKITVQQAVKMLRAMQQIPTNTEEMNRTLERKIRQLNEGLSTDLAMNISDEIKLPTLYEVRRANAESPYNNREIIGSAEFSANNQNYVDSKTINIVINESQDGPAMMAKLIEAIQGPSRSGVRPPSANSFYF